MKSDSPSRVRERVLAQHDLLRLRLQGLAEGVDAMLRGTLEVDELRVGCWETLALLRAHVKDEEAWLLPALSEADGFGPVRVDALHREHRAQARELSEAMDQLRAVREPEVLASGIEQLIKRILDDMDEEERTYLDPNVLRDSLVTTGFIG